MKIRTLFFVLLTVVFSTELSYGQLLTKKPTKKELLTEIQLLRKTIDSLKNELSGAAIELSDTVSTNDTINPGGINFFEGEDLIESKISTDSLLSLYYVQKKFSMVDDLYVDLDSAKLKSDIPDSVFIARLKAMNSFIPLPYNDIIKNHIVDFPPLMQFYEDRSIFWVDDIDIVNIILINVVKSCKTDTIDSSISGLEWFVDDEDRAFATDLFRKTIMGNPRRESHRNGVLYRTRFYRRNHPEIPFRL